jgi:hypothetical protein
MRAGKNDRRWTPPPTIEGVNESTPWYVRIGSYALVGYGWPPSTWTGSIQEWIAQFEHQRPEEQSSITSTTDEDGVPTMLFLGRKRPLQYHCKGDAESVIRRFKITGTAERA